MSRLPEHEPEVSVSVRSEPTASPEGPAPLPALTASQWLDALEQNVRILSRVPEALAERIGADDERRPRWEGWLREARHILPLVLRYGVGMGWITQEEADQIASDSGECPDFRDYFGWDHQYENHDLTRADWESLVDLIPLHRAHPGMPPSVAYGRVVLVENQWRAYRYTVKSPHSPERLCRHRHGDRQSALDCFERAFQVRGRGRSPGDAPTASDTAGT